MAAQYELMQIELSKTYGETEWRDDLKTLLRRTGIDGKQVVFLLSETQIKDDSFLEVWAEVDCCGDA